MPFNKTRVAATYAKEILRKVSGSEIAENSVVDGTTVPLNGDGRRILETGTVMIWMGAVGSSKVRPITTNTNPASGTDEVQTVTRSATPTAGTYTLTVPGYGTTTALATYSAAALQAAIRAIHADLVTVTVGLAGEVYTITFPDRQVAAVTVDTTTGALVATATPVTMTVATSQEGEVTAAMVAGIVMHTTEFWPETTEALKDDASVALFTTNCNFAIDKLIGFTQNAAAVRAAMSGAGNDRCANCTFAA